MGTRNTRWVALLATMAIVLYLCWLIIQPFIDVLLWGTVLAMVSYPAYLKLRGRGHSANMAAVYTTILVVLVVLIPAAFVTTAVAKQAAGAVNMVYQELNQPGGRYSQIVDRLESYIDVGPLRDPKQLGEKISSISGAIATRTFGLLGGILGAVVQIFFVLFTLYYLLRDADQIVPAVRRSLPLQAEQADVVFKRTHEVITASVNGVLVISAIQGALGAIGFYIAGMPSPLLWGTVMFLLSMIPMLGAFLVWIPAALYLMAIGRWPMAIFMTVWGGLVIGMIDNVLRPKLVGQRARLHELIIFFAVLGGLQVFGVLGLFVGPVVAAIALAMVDVFRRANQDADAQRSLEEGVTTSIPSAMAQEVTGGSIVSPLAGVGEVGKEVAAEVVIVQKREAADAG